MVAFPERAGLGWNQVNATAYAWLASEDSIDWDTKPLPMMLIGLLTVQAAR
jgi:hypothetical protein